MMSWKVHRKSLIYLGGCVGLMLFSAYMGEKRARNYVFGTDRN